MIKKIILILFILIITFILSLCVSSVFISPVDIVKILLYKFFNINLIANIDNINIDIICNIRIPRTILSFFVGACLAMSGVVIQSVLRNSLASTYNLGISSGSGVGIALLIISGISYNKYISIFVSILFSFITILFILFISGKINKNMNSNSIILAGIVISLFFYSFMSFLSYLFPKYSYQIVLFQFGSLLMNNFNYISIIIILSILILIILIKYSFVLDIMSFDDDSSLLLGVNPKKMRIFFILISSLITSILVAFTGVIGFIDLISPHISRKLFGAKNIVVVPISALIGGILLTSADICSRILIKGSDIPIGIVTAIIGAPFFLFVFISKKDGY